MSVNAEYKNLKSNWLKLVKREKKETKLKVKIKEKTKKSTCFKPNCENQ